MEEKCRIVLVTGSSRGIGKEIAIKFLEHGDIVFVNYSHSKTEAFKLKEKYNLAIPIYADVSKENDVISMISKIKTLYNRLDIVINNAGIANDSLVSDKTKDSFNKVIDTNLIGTFLVCKYAKNIMNKGCIINISSTNGIDTNYPYSLDYDASKAGVISLTHNLAQEYAPNIRVNSVAPGWVDTDMNKLLTEEDKERECKSILLNRFGTCKEIANVVYFLSSDEASYINSSIIRVDGGLK